LDNERLRIYYIWNHTIPDQPNRVLYQRPLQLGKRNQVYLLARGTCEIPYEIQQSVCIRRSPAMRLRILEMVVYYLWVAIVLARDAWDTDKAIVYTTRDETAALGFFGQRFGFKWVIDIWDDPGLELRYDCKRMQRLYYRTRVALLKLIIRYADLVICAILPDALQSYRVPQDRLLPVTNGIIAPLSGQSEWHGYGLGFGIEPMSSQSKLFRVLYIGFVMKETGIDTLLEGFAQANNRLIALGWKCELHLIGEVKEQSWLTNSLQQLGIENETTVWGRQQHSRVLELIAQCDVCVFPFPKAPEYDVIYPIKVLEYMTAGKPILVSNLRGVTCLVTPGQDCLAFEPGDADDLADKFIRLALDEQLRTRLGQAARLRSVQFDWAIVMKPIQDRLLGLLGTSNAGSHRRV
jgi:glycosyltransferase involved in cell wall biosynthesis